jgi:Protein of unknown function (DUF3313)
VTTLTMRKSILFGVVLFSGWLVGCATTGSSSTSPQMTEDGLKKVDVRGVDAAYVRPGASLGTYKRILLDPVQVSFSKDWKPQETGSYLPLSKEDRERIRKDLAELFTTTSTEVLEKGGYPVVTESGPDVLRVTARLADVYINAPDTMTPGRSYNFVMSAGQMTLIAELRDSETGQIMARVFDQREMRNDEFLRLSTSVSNSAEARDAVRTWANILLGRLNAVRVQPTPSP